MEKKGIISRLDRLTCILIIFYSDVILILSLIVLTIIVPVFDLGMSFGKVKSIKSLEFIFRIT